MWATHRSVIQLLFTKFMAALNWKIFKSVVFLKIKGISLFHGTCAFSMDLSVDRMRDF